MFKKRISQGNHLSIGMWLVLGMFLTIGAIPMIGSALSARAAPATDVCGPIASDTTWLAASSPYTVTCDVQVMSGVTLTIQSGVMVRFNASTSLRVDGTLIARGATFTSSKAVPAKGDWGHIFFTVTSIDATFDGSGNYVSGSILQDSLIEWGGGGASVSGAIETASASPFIDRNTIRNNGDSGIHAVARSANQQVVISRNSVTGNNFAVNGGGIYVSNGIVISNTVDGNWVNSGQGGGGINASSSTLSYNTVTGNNAFSTAGGGIYAAGSTLAGNTVSGNTASYAGGGVYASGGALTSNTVTGNTSTNGNGGGGIFASGGTLTDNVVSGNTAHGSNAFGGGIYSSLSTLTDNIVNNNTANSTYGDVKGGGIYAVGSSISNNSVSGNTASAPNTNLTGFGGGIYADGGTVVSNTVSGNTASGVKDGQGGGVYARTNTVQHNIIAQNSANLGGGLYSYKGNVTGNTVLTNTTTMTGTLYADEATATQNTIQANSANLGGGVYGYKATLTNNTIKSNTANVGAGVYANLSTLRANTVMSNTSQGNGGGVYANGGTATQNTVTFNTVPVFGRGSGAYLIGVSDFSYNTVTSNTALGGTAGGISVEGQPQIHYNNLYGNQPYDAEVVTSGNVSGTLNYWGPSACITIPGQIYDGNDMPGRGQLQYAPSFYSPLPVAQLSVPANLTIITGTSTITLTWTPIPAIPNIGCRGPGTADTGYRIYYAAGSSCPPFNGKGLAQGDSPIDVGDVTAISLRGLSSKEYSFVVTAHDYLGRESGYSNLVVGSLEQWKIYLPLVLKAS